MGITIDTGMTVLYIICGLAVAGCAVLFAAWVNVRRTGQFASERYAAEAAGKEVERQRAENLARALHEKDVQLARTEAEVAKLREKGESDRQELEKLQASFRLEFRSLANDILDEKSKQFKQTNKESLDQLLNPFKESITEFRKRVEDIYSNENVQRGALKNELKTLMDLNRQVTEETNNLTAALRGNSKVQGDWGEMLLETILERSNLTKGIHYETQTNIKDAAGNNIRPDFILNMPDGKRLVVDSKVSLTAYVNYTEAQDDDSRRRHLADHVRSVRSHVGELGKVGYQQNVLGSPDFVIMFIPAEPAFFAAMQADTELWNDAYGRQVIISAPTNLTAILMVVHDLWKRDDQSRNAIEIADEGAKLYDKFVGFVDTLETVGKNISSAQTNYDRAMNQLKTGSGNLIGRTEKLRKLGVKATKALALSLVESASEEEPDDTPDDTPTEKE